MKARDVMTSDPECVTPESSLQQAARLMRDGGFGAVPVVNDENDREVVGIITDRDIAIRHVAEGHTSSCSVRDHMTRDIQLVRADDDLDDVEDLMADEQIRRVPVVDKDDRLVGMIAQADVARKADSDDVGKTIRDISKRGGDHTTD